MLDLATKNKAIELLTNHLAYNGYLFTAIDILREVDNETMETELKNRYLEVVESGIKPKF